MRDFTKGYQPTCNIVKDEKGDLVADSHGIVARWRNSFLPAIQRAWGYGCWAGRIHTAGTTTIDKLKSHKIARY